MECALAAAGTVIDIYQGMKCTALTVWNGIISPVFDAANTFLIINNDSARETFRIDAASPMETAGVLKAKNVSVVICGAISTVPLQLLMQNGITAISFIRGNVEEVIVAYRQGALASRPFLMPGCGRFGCKGNRHGRRRGHMPFIPNDNRRCP